MRLDQRPKPRAGSSDSFPAVTDAQAELILQLLGELRSSFDSDREERISERGRDLARLADIESTLRELEKTALESKAETLETRALRHAVERLLTNDIGQNAEIAALREAKAAGRSAGARWASVGTTLGTILAIAVTTAINRCDAERASERPAPTYPAPK